MSIPSSNLCAPQLLRPAITHFNPIVAQPKNLRLEPHPLRIRINDETAKRPAITVIFGLVPVYCSTALLLYGTRRRVSSRDPQPGNTFSRPIASSTLQILRARISTSTPPNIPPSSSNIAHDDVSDAQDAHDDVPIAQDAQGDAAANHNHDDAQDLSSVADQDHRPSDYVFDFVPPVIVRDPIVHQKNLQATIAIMRTGGEILDGQVIADGKLIRFEDWKPEMEPFYTPAVRTRTNVYSSTNMKIVDEYVLAILRRSARTIQKVARVRKSFRQSP
ncbi:hypothetical protein K440DRAFT_636892 [Wilcoxina mikolae CBS 423.85]|nr:hypothetical protein K440DRAFT_636892 [Wilcoxina mikolae CBS 423.85]